MREVEVVEGPRLVEREREARVVVEREHAVPRELERDATHDLRHREAVVVAPADLRHALDERAPQLPELAGDDVRPLVTAYFSEKMRQLEGAEIEQPLPVGVGRLAQCADDLVVRASKCRRVRAPPFGRVERTQRRTDGSHGATHSGVAFSPGRPVVVAR